MSTDLVDFLLACIADDEATARAAISWQADPENGWGYDGRALTPHVGIIHEAVQAEHITRWHPAHVLAECEAKRRIVAQHRRDPDADGYPDGDTCTMCIETGPEAQGWPCDTLRALALPYSDRPGYHPEWAPSDTPNR